MTLDMIAATNYASVGGTLPPAAGAGQRANAASVGESLRWTKGKLMTLARAAEMVSRMSTCITGVKVNATANPAALFGDPITAHEVQPMGRRQAILHIKATMGHRESTVRACYDAVVAGELAVQEWCEQVAAQKCSRTGKHLKILPKDILQSLDDLLQLEVIIPGHDLSAAVVVEKAGELGMIISSSTGQRALDVWHRVIVKAEEGLAMLWANPSSFPPSEGCARDQHMGGRAGCSSFWRVPGAQVRRHGATL